MQFETNSKKTFIINTFIYYCASTTVSSAVHKIVPRKLVLLSRTDVNLKYCCDCAA